MKNLRAGVFKEGYFVIALSDSETDLLEILPVELFGDPVYVRYHNPDELRVVGLAVTKREADDLMMKIVMYVHKHTGAFDVKGFFTFPGQPDRL